MHRFFYSQAFTGAALAGAVALLSPMRASAEPIARTSPAVFVPTEVSAQSDALLATPGHRAPAAEVTVGQTVGETVMVSVLGRNPGWEQDRFLATGEDQPESYYVLVMGGPAEGRSYPVVDSGMNALTLDGMGEPLAALLGPGTRLQVIPYWTPVSLFAEGFPGSSSISGAGAPAELMLFSAAPGKDRAADKILYYYSGTGFGGPGWRIKGGGFTNIADHLAIPTDAAFIYRNNRADAAALGLAASMQMTRFATVLGTLEAQTPQDNYVGIPVAEPTTLHESGLAESGLFQPALGISGVGADKVFVYDNAAAGKNKAFAEAYYYYDGPLFGGPGWRKAGGGFANLAGDAEVFVPGKGYAIRFEADEEPAANYWSFLPGYLE